MDEELEDDLPRSSSLRTPKEYVDLSKRQAPLFNLVSKCHALFWELPDISTKEVDVRLRSMFEDVLSACQQAGISRMSIPPLKECCGKTRAWTESLPLTAIPPKKEPWKLGDALKRVFEFLGLKSCAGCERRRAFLNRIRLPK